MTTWTLIDSDTTLGRTFQRPLDVIEHTFFLDGLCNGSTDILHYLELRLLNGDRDAQLFSEENIVRSWLSTKRRFPLAGATVRRQEKGHSASTDSQMEEDDITEGIDWEPHFVVRECNLSVLRPREVVFAHVANEAEAKQQATGILNGPRPLSDDLLVQLYVFRETDSDRTRQDILYVSVLAAHCVADELAIRTFVRCFLDTLARGAGSQIAQMPLEDRLAMAVPAGELKPEYLRSLSPARRRWRRAIAAVIVQLRFPKMQGSHTLPCRRTRHTEYTSARSGIVETFLTPAQTAKVIANSSQLQVAFRNIYLVLAQVAMTCVLNRRYLRGEISEDEWMFRKTQPYISQGLISLRPYLDKTWFGRGGGGEFVLSMGGCNYQLPFMTVGRTAGRRDTEHAFPDGAPPFSDLMTVDRLLHRTRFINKLAAAFLNSPLFFEIIDAVLQTILQYQRITTSQLMKGLETSDPGENDEEETLTVEGNPSLFTHEGSNFGNMDLTLPSEYPLPPTHALSPYSPTSHPSKAGYSTLSLSAADTSPKITVDFERTQLHANPGQLYLGSASWRGQLKMFVFYDRNVFDEGVVREWLDEVKEALLQYLGNVGCQQLKPHL